MATYTPWLRADLTTEVGVGFIQQFGSLILNGTYTFTRNGDGPHFTAVAYVRNMRQPLSSPTIDPGIMIMPGGRVYSAFPYRSPRALPQWSADFLVRGDSDAIMAVVAEAQARKGRDFNLIFSGANSLLDMVSDQFYAKRCPAKLLQVDGAYENTLLSPTPTSDPTTLYKSHVILQMVWQQLDDMEVIA